MEGDFFSLVNIRLPLENFSFKKRHRRILRKNLGKFRTIIRAAAVTPEKERLYQQQKHRFKGFIFDSLLEFLETEMRYPIFNTYEVCIYDGEKLIALSYFDIGAQSVASLIGLYDQSIIYKKYSLGILSMLLEIEYSVAANKKFYYPGYILDQESEFDYKLQFGKFDYYNWKGRWRPMEKFAGERMTSHLLREKLNELKSCLHTEGISYEQKLYPFFSIGYLEPDCFDLVKSIVLIQCFPELKSQCLIIEYIVEEDYFIFSRINTQKNYEELIDSTFSHDLLQSDKYWLELLYYERIICKHANPQKIAEVARYLKG